MEGLSKREQAVYNLLQDTQSEQVFLALKKYSHKVTMKPQNVVQGLLNTDFLSVAAVHAGQDYPHLSELQSLLREKSFVIYGAGNLGRGLVLWFTELSMYESIAAIIDINASEICVGNTHHMKVYSSEQFLKSNSDKHIDYYLIATLSENHSEAMKTKLREYGVDDNKIIEMRRFACSNEEDIYFDSQIIIPKLGAKEVFIDGGSFDFNDSLRFLNLCPDGKVYAFEPDHKSYANIVKNINTDNANTNVINGALHSESDSLTFNSTGLGGASLSCDNYNCMVAAYSLDEIIPDSEKVSFIKMDIEGAELNALKGAEKTIYRNKPKLAISIYHKPNDYLEIPEFIYSLVPEYSFYMRHYSRNPGDTVLYCVI